MTQTTLTRRSVDPLRDAARMAEMIADVVGVSPADAARRLRQEFDRPGSTVADDFARRGLTPHAWTGGLIDFYSRTDAFVYELAVWNRNAIKREMRRWVVEYLARAGRPLDVLSIGDGLGFDCRALAGAGHRVTYYELPGYAEAFARRLFASAGAAAAAIAVVTDAAALPGEAYDAVCCLDVLEHVPDPPAQVRDMAARLRPGGLLVVSAPYWLVHPAYPTHLRSNRRFTGSLRPYAAAGLVPIDGRLMWDPLVLRKPAGATGPASPAGAIRPAAVARRLLLRLTGRLMAGTGWTGLPARATEWVRGRTTQWFE